MVNHKNHEYGILCLTCGIGYLPVTEYSHNRLVMQDPRELGIYHTFKSLESACAWLNRLVMIKSNAIIKNNKICLIKFVI